MKNSQITIANTPAQIRRCHPVMRQLRPLFQDPEHFVERVLRQQKQRYLLAFLEFDGEVCAVAGYRFLESLFSGKFLYVDDLVTREGDRSRGFGGANEIDCRWNATRNGGGRFTLSREQRPARRRDDGRNPRLRYFQSASQ